jgi:hypothetical protein
MSYTVLAYCLYIPITFFVTVWVGLICYRNGEMYLYGFFGKDKDWVAALNKLLLVGYYLINLGYAMLVAANWEMPSNYAEMIAELADKVGFILMGLGVMHLFNLLTFKFLGSHFKRKFLNPR